MFISRYGRLSGTGVVTSCTEYSPLQKRTAVTGRVAALTKLWSERKCEFVPAFTSIGTIWLCVCQMKSISAVVPFLSRTQKNCFFACKVTIIF